MPKNTISTAIVAGSVATALSMTTASAQESKGVTMEKCYGISTAGKNDCAAGPGTTCAGTSKIDYQGNAWTLIPVDLCENGNFWKKILPDDRMGSLEPLERDLPES